MSFENRICKLESLYQPRELSDDDDARDEFERLFLIGDAAGAELVEQLAAKHGTRQLHRLLRIEGTGLRRIVGQFARRERLMMPGAKLVKFRNRPGAEDASIIVPLEQPRDGCWYLQLYGFDATTRDEDSATEGSAV